MQHSRINYVDSKLSVWTFSYKSWIVGEAVAKAGGVVSRSRDAAVYDSADVQNRSVEMLETRNPDLLWINFVPPSTARGSHVDRMRAKTIQRTAYKAMDRGAVLLEASASSVGWTLPEIKEVRRRAR